jgi:tetratricopeptide (TPR) repeat protein
VRTDVAALRAARAKQEKADHFEVLGVARNTAAAQVKAAYFVLARAWHPDSTPPEDGPEAHDLRAALFARLSEAWSVLGDEAARKKYLEELESGGVADVDVAAILEAESIFQQATVMVKARQYPRALEELEKAIALNKDEPEFHVWRAWAQFLASQDRKRLMPALAAEIENALKKLPRCMPAYLFLGQMAKVAGDLALAEKHFKRGLAVEPSDADLNRELKYLRK